MRPIYETPGDRDRERAALDRLAWRELAAVRIAPLLCGWDAELIRDGLTIALVEVKCRNNAMRDYADYMVSDRKARGIVAAAEWIGVAALLLVAWSDRVGVADLTGRSWATATGGRTDRGDPLDIERVALLPIGWFDPL